MTENILTYFRKEMEGACKKNMKYKFDWYLMISKAYKQKPTKKGKAVDTEILYTNQEEEFLKKVRVLWFANIEDNWYYSLRLGNVHICLIV